CEAVGFCSFSDSSCAGGQRFGDSAGPYAGQCVGETGGDAGVDAMQGDGSGPPGCPSGYKNAGSQPPMYKIITTPTDGHTQRASWGATKAGGGAYLATPDAASELSDTDNPAGGNGQYWLGINDMATPGTFVTVKDPPQTFLPWAGGQPDGPPRTC